jgi:SAM-dependent methyltransferase
MERVASRLAPGTALDVGCGEGSDAVWLASQGWHVTATDLSQVALDRGKAHEPTGRVTWLQADILAWTPPVGAFDLVASHFLHFDATDRQAVFRKLADAVKPGGTLLVVAHHPTDLETTAGRWRVPDLFFTASEIAAMLDASWELDVDDASPRTVRDPDGNLITVHDTVLVARRCGILGNP